MIASVSTAVLQDSADELILGIFLFLLAVCVVLLFYVVAALLKQGILGGALALGTGYGLIMLHTLAQVYTIPTSWKGYVPFMAWTALLVFCDLVLVLAAGFVPWAIRRWLLNQRGRQPRLRGELVLRRGFFLG